MATALDRDVTARRWAMVMPHRAELLRIARTRTVSEADAEDCVSEAMLRCVEFGNLDESRLLPFLVSTTTRLAADQHRRRRQSDRLGVKLSGWFAAESAPDDAVCDRAEAAWVAARVASLPEQQRTVLSAKADGMSCTEVAERFRLSYKAVESSLSRARTQVRTALATTFGLAIAVFRRGRAAAVAPVAALSLAAFATATLLSAEPVAAPPGDEIESTLTERPDARRIAPVRPFAGPPRRTVVAPPRGPAMTPVRRADPVATPDLPDLPVKDTEVEAPTGDKTGIKRKEHDYTTTERVMHCVEYGVQVEIGGTIECRYPPEPS